MPCRSYPFSSSAYHQGLFYTYPRLMNRTITQPLLYFRSFVSQQTHATRFPFLACVCRAVVETGGLVKRFREFVVFNPAAIDILYLVRGSYKLADR